MILKSLLLAAAVLTGTAHSCLVVPIIGCSGCSKNCGDGISHCAVSELCLNDHVGGCSDAYTTTATATATYYAAAATQYTATSPVATVTYVSVQTSVTSVTVSSGFVAPEQSPPQSGPLPVSAQGAAPMVLFFPTTVLDPNAPAVGSGGAGVRDCDGPTQWSVFTAVSTTVLTTTTTFNQVLFAGSDTSVSNTVWTSTSYVTTTPTQEPVSQPDASTSPTSILTTSAAPITSSSTDVPVSYMTTSSSSSSSSASAAASSPVAIVSSYTSGVSPSESSATAAVSTTIMNSGAAVTLSAASVARYNGLVPLISLMLVGYTSMTMYIWAV